MSVFVPYRHVFNFYFKEQQTEKISTEKQNIHKIIPKQPEAKSRSDKLLETLNLFLSTDQICVYMRFTFTENKVQMNKRRAC